MIDPACAVRRWGSGSSAPRSGYVACRAVTDRSSRRSRAASTASSGSFERSRGVGLREVTDAVRWREDAGESATSSCEAARRRAARARSWFVAFPLGRQWQAGLLRPLACEGMPVAGAVDVGARGGGGEPVEDRGGEGGVAEVLAPGRQLDVGSEGGRDVQVPPVEEREEQVGRGRLLVPAFELPEAHVVDDEQ